MMRISVALCTYHGQQYLPEQLASIAAQDRPPDEVVACDDGSTDATLDLLGRFASGSPFPVRVVRNALNLGSTANFGQAIGLGSGDVIATADQDDAWLPHKLARIESTFEANPGVGLVFSDADLIDGQGQPIGVRLWEAAGLSSGRAGRIARGEALQVLLRRPVVTGAASAFRAEFRALVLPIPEGVVHDEWIATLVAAAAAVVPIAEPLMRYRQHGGNQVGVAEPGLASRLRKTLAPDSQRARLAIFAERAATFGLIRDRLAERRPDLGAALGRIDDKIRHVEALARLPRGRLARLPELAAELASGRYTRNSGSWLAVVRDLLARP